MEYRYSPYNSPFVPAGTGIYWIPREYQYAPHDQHVRDYYAHLESYEREYQLMSNSIVDDQLNELAALAFDCGIKAARYRYRDVQNKGVKPFADQDRFRCLD